METARVIDKRNKILYFLWKHNLELKEVSEMETASKCINELNQEEFNIRYAAEELVKCDPDIEKKRQNFEKDKEEIEFLKKVAEKTHSSQKIITMLDDGLSKFKDDFNREVQTYVTATTNLIDERREEYKNRINELKTPVQDNGKE